MTKIENTLARALRAIAVACRLFVILPIFWPVFWMSTLPAILAVQVSAVSYAYAQAGQLIISNLSVQQLEASVFTVLDGNGNPVERTLSTGQTDYGSFNLSIIRPT